MPNEVSTPVFEKLATDPTVCEKARAWGRSRLMWKTGRSITDEEEVRAVIRDISAGPGTKFAQQEVYHDAVRRIQRLLKAGVAPERLEESLLQWIPAGDWVTWETVSTIGSEESVAVLKRMVRTLKFEDYSYHAVSGMGALEVLTQIGKRRPELVVPFLLKLEKEPQRSMHWAVLRSMAALGQAEFIPFLVQAAQTETSPEFLRLMVSGIYLAGGPKAEAALNELKGFAAEQGNVAMGEFCDEGLLRLERERAGR